jgi:hypothetical protein
MPIKKIRGYLIKGNNPIDFAATDATNTIEQQNPNQLPHPNQNQRLLCAVETCLEYATFPTIFCDYHNNQADKAWLSIDAFNGPAHNDETDVVFPTRQGRHAVASNQRRHIRRIRTVRPIHNNQMAVRWHIWLGSDDGGDAA